MKTLMARNDVKVLVWVAVSNALVAMLSYMVQNPDLYDPKWVGLANVLLVSVWKRK